ncbi:RNA-directed DNA polymerase (Reverse transcriptase), partial [Trifolium medium]|nr:RNA-directed DNA polymerase (Reverse transcriptase) [Trifolium medium]
EWLELWGACLVWVLPRDVSDHCPLVVKNSNNDWGPKPFRFNNHWMVHKNFKKVVEDRWREKEVTGWMGFVLKEKLRGLNVRLKEWNKVEFGNAEGRMKKLVEDIQDLDVRGEIMGLAPHEVNLRKALCEDFWKLQKFKEASIVQRSRSKWLSQGDANSKFFHRCVLTRKKRNSIVALMVCLF